MSGDNHQLNAAKARATILQMGEIARTLKALHLNGVSGPHVAIMRDALIHIETIANNVERSVPLAPVAVDKRVITSLGDDADLT